MRNKLIGVLVIIYTVVVLLVAVHYSTSRPTSVVLDNSSTRDVYKTVAHLQIDSPELELIYSDPVSDVAYYRYIGERTQLDIGDIVYLTTGEKCRVTNIDITGFYLEGATTVQAGMSGTIVTNSNGDTVGYVSSTSNGKLYCIWS